LSTGNFDRLQTDLGEDGGRNYELVFSGKIDYFYLMGVSEMDRSPQS
jgi:hypothetical protein